MDNHLLYLMLLVIIVAASLFIGIRLNQKQEDDILNKL
jgi:hypothetical protein